MVFSEVEPKNRNKFDTFRELPWPRLGIAACIFKPRIPKDANEKPSNFDLPGLHGRLSGEENLSREPDATPAAPRTNYQFPRHGGARGQREYERYFRSQWIRDHGRVELSKRPDLSSIDQRSCDDQDWFAAHGVFFEPDRSGKLLGHLHRYRSERRRQRERGRSGTPRPNPGRSADGNPEGQRSGGFDHRHPQFRRYSELVQRRCHFL